MKLSIKDQFETFDWSKSSLGPKAQWPISLRTIVDVILNSQMPMHMSWGPLGIQFHNDAYRSLIEDERGDLLGQTLKDTWADRLDLYQPILDHVLQGNSIYQKDHVGKIFRGGVEQDCHFTLSMSPVRNDEGIVAGILTTAVETTKEINEMQELKHILEQAPLPISIVEGRENLYTFSNRAHDNLVGKQVQGKKMIEVFPAEEVEKGRYMREKIYQDKKPFLINEHLVNWVNDKGQNISKWFDIGFYPYLGRNQEVKGFFTIAADITEPVKARLLIEKALKARDEFISIASHEFKTPVSSLKLQFQMIERNMKKGIPFTDESLKKMLNLSLRQIEGLSRLIEDLLDATKANNERMSFKFQESEISTIVADAIGHVSDYLHDHETPLSSTVDESITLNCDPFRIEQVITNLLTNASKYGNYKPISLDVKKVNNAVKICVSDQGIGISEENFGKIFNRFERGDVTKNYAGLGLGLYITKHIVDAHHGSIDIQSKPGQGSTFTVTLPLNHN